jgi:hypothetical protein
MKRWIAVASCVSVTAAALLAWYTGTASRAGSGVPLPPAGPEGEAMLGVEALMKSADPPRGPLLVEGVVSAVSADTRTFALIDLREFQECGIADCALTLPVRWAGAMPAIRDVVRVRGGVKEAKGKLVFVASTMEKTNLRMRDPK